MQNLNVALAAVVLSASASAATAAPVVFSVLGGAASGSTLWNMDVGVLAPAGLTVTATPSAAFVTGEMSGIYAPPFLSGGNGTGFGSPDQPNGVNTTQFLTTGSTGFDSASKVTFQFNSAQQSFGLLWGSVDSYNTMTFFNGATSLGQITGTDVTATANGDQGALGTFYVTINSAPFDRIEFTSSQFAFEFDNVSWSPNQVPLPGTLALLGLGLIAAAARGRKTA